MFDNASFASNGRNGTITMICTRNEEIDRLSHKLAISDTNL